MTRFVRGVKLSLPYMALWPRPTVRSTRSRICLGSTPNSRNTRTATPFSSRTTGRNDQREITCGHDTYRATLSWSPYPVPATSVNARLGWNNTDVYVDIEICRGGTEVRIRPLVDLPQAVSQAMQNLLRGRAPLSGVQITPQLQIRVLQSQTSIVTLQGGPTVDPNTGQVTGGRGQPSGCRGSPA